MIGRALGLGLGLALAQGALAAAPATAEAPPPPALREVGVDERIGERIPLDLLFSEAGGRRIRLGELFGDGRPVLLVLAYVRCRMMCSLVLHGASQAVREMPLEPGRDYRLITVSIDPGEDAATAAARRRELLRAIGRPGEPERWTYLVGHERPVRALADALGFRYAWDSRTEQFAHPAVVFVLTPDGRISRYVHGVTFAPAELAGALRAAGAGALGGGSLAERVLACFRFDPAARAHRERIERYLRIGGGGVLLALGSTVSLLWWWERRRRRSP
ncbi:MAG TPA: SCO family protein [Kofleriaceae bacterium]|nr:SCO family protein [Kofleriaceae bacterium]